MGSHTQCLSLLQVFNAGITKRCSEWRALPSNGVQVGIVIPTAYCVRWLAAAGVGESQRDHHGKEAFPF